jgi:hypothetical protein
MNINLWKRVCMIDRSCYLRECHTLAASVVSSGKNDFCEDGRKVLVAEMKHLVPQAA